MISFLSQRQLRPDSRVFLLDSMGEYILENIPDYVQLGDRPNEGCLHGPYSYHHAK